MGPAPTTREGDPSRDHAMPARHNTIIEPPRATQGGARITSLGKKCVWGVEGPYQTRGTKAGDELVEEEKKPGGGRE
jgi:hypothetical protein